MVDYSLEKRKLLSGILNLFIFFLFFLGVTITSHMIGLPPYLNWLLIICLIGLFNIAPFFPGYENFNLILVKKEKENLERRLVFCRNILGFFTFIIDLFYIPFQIVSKKKSRRICDLILGLELKSR